MIKFEVILAFLLVFSLLWFLLHRFVFPLIIKNYKNTSTRNSKYEKEIDKISKKK